MPAEATNPLLPLPAERPGFHRGSPARPGDGAQRQAPGMVSPELVVCTLGHLASIEELRERGVPTRAIRAAVGCGALTRVARGRYACAHLETLQGREELGAAARAHGRIGCLSALRRASVWAGTDRRLHIQLRPGQHGTRRDRVDLRGRPIVYHWTEPFPWSGGPLKTGPSRAGQQHDDETRFAAGRCWLVEPMEAVWRAIHCLDEENAIACLESAVHEGFITRDELWEISALAPEHLQAGIAEIEFTADSGQETIVRRRLRHAGYRVVAQESITGLPAEDLVVEDCVNLETDGKKWHGPDRFHADRERDLVYEGLGRRVLRLTQRHILYEWETTFLVIKRVVEDAQREQQRRHGRPLE